MALIVDGVTIINSSICIRDHILSSESNSGDAFAPDNTIVQSITDLGSNYACSRLTKRTVLYVSNKVWNSLETTLLSDIIGASSGTIWKNVKRADVKFQFKSPSGSSWSDNPIYRTSCKMSYTDGEAQLITTGAARANSHLERFNLKLKYSGNKNYFGSSKEVELGEYVVVPGIIPELYPENIANPSDEGFNTTRGDTHKIRFKIPTLTIPYLKHSGICLRMYCEDSEVNSHLDIQPVASERTISYKTPSELGKNYWLIYLSNAGNNLAFDKYIEGNYLIFEFLVKYTGSQNDISTNIGFAFELIDNLSFPNDTSNWRGINIKAEKFLGFYIFKATCDTLAEEDSHARAGEYELQLDSTHIIGRVGNELDTSYIYRSNCAELRCRANVHSVDKASINACGTNGKLVVNFYEHGTNTPLPITRVSYPSSKDDDLEFIYSDNYFFNNTFSSLDGSGTGRTFIQERTSPSYLYFCPNAGNHNLKTTPVKIEVITNYIGWPPASASGTSYTSHVLSRFFCAGPNLYISEKSDGSSITSYISEAKGVSVYEYTGNYKDSKTYDVYVRCHDINILKNVSSGSGTQATAVKSALTHSFSGNFNSMMNKLRDWTTGRDTQQVLIDGITSFAGSNHYCDSSYERDNFVAYTEFKTKNIAGICELGDVDINYLHNSSSISGIGTYTPHLFEKGQERDPNSVDIVGYLGTGTISSEKIKYVCVNVDKSTIKTIKFTIQDKRQDVTIYEDGASDQERYSGRAYVSCGGDYIPSQTGYEHTQISGGAKTKTLFQGQTYQITASSQASPLKIELLGLPTDTPNVVVYENNEVETDDLSTRLYRIARPTFTVKSYHKNDVRIGTITVKFTYVGGYTESFTIKYTVPTLAEEFYQSDADLSITPRLTGDQASSDRFATVYDGQPAHIELINMPDQLISHIWKARLRAVEIDLDWLYMGTSHAPAGSLWDVEDGFANWNYNGSPLVWKDKSGADSVANIDITRTTINENKALFVQEVITFDDGSTAITDMWYIEYINVNAFVKTINISRKNLILGQSTTITCVWFTPKDNNVPALSSPSFSISRPAAFSVNSEDFSSTEVGPNEESFCPRGYLCGNDTRKILKNVYTTTLTSQSEATNVYPEAILNFNNHPNPGGKLIQLGGNTESVYINITDPLNGAYLDITGSNNIKHDTTGSYTCAIISSDPSSLPTDITYTWSTSSSNLPIVSGQGTTSVVVGGKKTGSFTLTCTANVDGVDLVSDINITVESNYTLSLSSSEETISLPGNKVISITAKKGTSDAAYNKLSFEHISSNTTIDFGPSGGTPSYTFKVTASDFGDDIVTVKLKDDSNDVVCIDSITIHVVPDPDNYSWTIPEDKTIYLNQEFDFNVSAKRAGTNLNKNQISISKESGDSVEGSYNSSTGVFHYKALSEGSDTFSVKLTDGGEEVKTGEFTITVEDAVSSASISISGPHDVPDGGTIELEAFLDIADETLLEGLTYNWNQVSGVYSKYTIVSGQGTNKVTISGNSVGPDQIYVNVNINSQTIASAAHVINITSNADAYTLGADRTTVNVIKGNTVSVSIDPKKNGVRVNSDYLSLSPSSSSVASATWDSTDRYKIKFKGLSQGQQKYVVSLEDDSETIVKTVTITVNVSDPGTGASMAINGLDSVEKNESITLTAELIGINESDVPSDIVYTWSLNNDNMSILSGQGTSEITLKGVTPGQCEVCCTTDIYEVHVVASPKEIAIIDLMGGAYVNITGQLSILENTTTTLTATLNANGAEVTDGVTYSWTISSGNYLSIVSGQDGKNLELRGDSIGSGAQVTCTATAHGESVSKIVSVSVTQNSSIYDLSATDSINVNINSSVTIEVTAKINGSIAPENKLSISSGAFSTSSWDGTWTDGYKLKINGVTPGTDNYVVELKDSSDNTVKSIDIEVCVVDPFINANLVLSRPNINTNEGSTEPISANVEGVEEYISVQVIYEWRIINGFGDISIKLNEGVDNAIDIECTQPGQGYTIKCIARVGDRWMQEKICTIDIESDTSSYTLEVGGHMEDWSDDIYINSTGEPILIKAENSKGPVQVSISRNNNTSIFTDYEYDPVTGILNYWSFASAGTDVYIISANNSRNNAVLQLKLTINVIDISSNCELTIDGDQKIDLKGSKTYNAILASTNPAVPLPTDIKYNWSTQTNIASINGASNISEVEVKGNYAGNTKLICTVETSNGLQIASSSKTIMVEGYSLSVDPTTYTLETQDSVTIQIVALKDGRNVDPRQLVFTPQSSSHVSWEPDLNNFQIVAKGSIPNGSDIASITLNNESGVGVVTASTKITVATPHSIGSAVIKGPGVVKDTEMKEFKVDTSGIGYPGPFTYEWSLVSGADGAELRLNSADSNVVNVIGTKAGTHAELKCTIRKGHYSWDAYKEFDVDSNTNIWHIVTDREVHVDEGETIKNSINIIKYHVDESENIQFVPESQDLIIERTAAGGGPTTTLMFKEAEGELWIKGGNKGTFDVWVLKYKDPNGVIVAETDITVYVDDPAANATLSISAPSYEINENEKITLTATISDYPGVVYDDLTFNWNISEARESTAVWWSSGDRTAGTGYQVDVKGIRVGYTTIKCLVTVEGHLLEDEIIVEVKSSSEYSILINDETIDEGEITKNLYVWDTQHLGFKARCGSEFIPYNRIEITKITFPVVTPAPTSSQITSSSTSGDPNLITLNLVALNPGQDKYKVVVKDTGGNEKKTLTLIINVTNPLADAILTLDPSETTTNENTEKIIKAEFVGVDVNCNWSYEYHWQILRGEHNVIEFKSGTPTTSETQALVSAVNVGEAEVTCVIKFPADPSVGKPAIIINPQNNTIITVSSDVNKYKLYEGSTEIDGSNNEDTIYAGITEPKTKVFSVKRVIGGTLEEPCKFSVILPTNATLPIQWNEDTNSLIYTSETNVTGDNVVEFRLLDANDNVVKIVNYTIHVLDAFEQAVVDIKAEPDSIIINNHAEVGIRINIPGIAPGQFRDYMCTREWIITDNDGPNITTINMTPYTNVFTVKGMKIGTPKIRCKLTSVCGTVKETGEVSLNVTSGLGLTKLSVTLDTNKIPVLNGKAVATATITDLPAGIDIRDIEWSIDRDDVRRYLVDANNKLQVHIATPSVRSNPAAPGTVTVTCRAITTPGDEVLEVSKEITLMSQAAYYRPSLLPEVKFAANPPEIYVGGTSEINLQYKLSLIPAEDRPSQGIRKVRGDNCTIWLNGSVYKGISEGTDEYIGWFKFNDGSGLNTSNTVSIKVNAATKDDAKYGFHCYPNPITVGQKTKIISDGVVHGEVFIETKYTEIVREDTSKPAKTFGDLGVDNLITGKLVGQEGFIGIVTLTNDEVLVSDPFYLTINGFGGDIKGAGNTYINVTPATWVKPVGETKGYWEMDIYVGETKSLKASVISMPEPVQCTKLYLGAVKNDYFTAKRVRNEWIDITGTKVGDLTACYVQVFLDDGEIFTIDVRIHVKDPSEGIISFDVIADEEIFISQTSTICVNYTLAVPNMLESVVINNVRYKESGVLKPDTGSTKYYELSHEYTYPTNSLWTLYGGKVCEEKILADVTLKFETGTSVTYSDIELTKVLDPVEKAEFTISIDPKEILIGEEAVINLNWQWPESPGHNGFETSFNIDRI